MIHRDRNLSGHWGRTEAGWGRPRRGGLQTHLLLVKVPDVRTAWPWHDRSRKVGHNVLESSVLVRRLALDHQRRVLDQHYKTFFAAPSYHRPSVFFIKPHSHPNGFYWVTNSHGPLPQPTSCSLKTATGSNHKPNSPVWGGWGSKSGPNISWYVASPVLPIDPEKYHLYFLYFDRWDQAVNIHLPTSSKYGWPAWLVWIRTDK